MRALLIVTALLGVTACTAAPSAPAPSTDVTRTRTVAESAPPPDPVPLRSGPTTADDASTCPLLATQTAADDVGMRLARVQVLRVGDSVSGCRFYALQGSPLATSEHLPGPSQAVIAIDVIPYRSTVAAHNATVLRARAGTDATQVSLPAGQAGVVYRTTFDPADRGGDWACAVARGTVLTVVTTAVSDTSVNAVSLAGDVLRSAR